MPARADGEFAVGERIDPIGKKGDGELSALNSLRPLFAAVSTGQCRSLLISLDRCQEVQGHFVGDPGDSSAASVAWSQTGCHAPAPKKGTKKGTEGIKRA